MGRGIAFAWAFSIAAAHAIPPPPFPSQNPVSYGSHSSHLEPISLRLKAILSVSVPDKPSYVLLATDTGHLWPHIHTRTIPEYACFGNATM
jgi:hypothetical protein